MSQFTITSIRERLLLQQFEDKQKDFTIIYTTPVTGYSSFDAIIYSANTWYKVEVKVRDKYPLARYNDWLIEKPKYDTLTASTFQTLYINIHSDGVQVWTIKQATEPNWIYEYNPKTTQGDNRTVSKCNGYLSQFEASIYKSEYNLNQTLQQAENIFKNNLTF